MATYPSYRRTRTAAMPRCIDCGEFVASRAIVRCGFCSRQQQPINHNDD
jgi:hypothetical protein